MFKRDRIYEDLSLILLRVRIVFIVAGILLALLLVYYWKVQVLDYQKYWRMSEANRLRERALPAPRGVITDRSGRIILADNTAGFKVSIIRENIKDYAKTCRDVARLLGISEDDLRARIDKYRDTAAFEPIVVKDGLTTEEVARIEARRSDFPELEVGIEPRRSYPFGSSTAHVLGYLQEASLDELRSGAGSGRRMGEMIGRTGIERQYEETLRGEDGRLLEVVDSLGKSRGEMAREEPKRGESVRLTLDYDIQRMAEEGLEGKEGAVVVLEPETGDILALASYPNFEPARFINRFTPEEWMSLIGDPNFPLENRAIRGLYSPGSIFKIVMALASLDAGYVNPETAYFCSGAQEIYGAVRSCWFKPGHGSMNLTNAIKNSCNIYFYNLGQRMGIVPIASYARMLGFGRKTGIDIPGEKEGLVPDPDWKKKTTGAVWYRGETISVAIGQGPLLVTPLQIAGMTACVANRGIRAVPRLGVGGEGVLGTAGERIPLKTAAFESVIRGMWMSVNAGGTGRGAQVEGFDVCGKTGSTQWISTERAEKLAQQGREVRKTHSWFSGFAPMSDPKIVVTVLVEFGGSGGSAAAPLAGRIFDLYRKKYDR
jgi:penicillin-binding protein 2